MEKSLIEIVRASDALKLFTSKRYNNWSTAIRISKLAKLLEENKNFLVEQERKIIDHYAEKDESGQIIIANGTQITFKDAESKQMFQDELNKLHETMIQVPDIIVIKPSDFAPGEVSISPDDMLKIEGFIDFIFDDGENHDA